MSQYLNLLKKRPNFRRLWLATVISLGGDWFNTIASLIIVNKYTESGLAISWILIARTLPLFLVSPLAGVVADRYDRKKLLIITDVLRAGIVLSFLFVDRPERIWLIYVLTAVQFVFSSFFEPAFSAIMPGLVEGEDEILTANVISSVTWSAMMAIGSALGGVFTNAFGVRAALVLDAVSFLFSAAFIFRIKINRERIVSASGNGWTDLIAGARFVAQRPKVFSLAMVKGLSQIGNGDIIMGLFASRIFILGNEGASALGIMFTAAGIGAILGPLVGKYVFDDTNRRLMNIAILVGFIFIPLGWLIIGWGPSIWVVSLGLLVRFMGGSANWTFSSVLIQLEVPDRFLGRVFALDMAFFTLMSSLSVWISGYLVDEFGLGPRSLVFIILAGNILPGLIWMGRLKETRPSESQIHLN